MSWLDRGRPGLVTNSGKEPNSTRKAATTGRPEDEALWIPEGCSASPTGRCLYGRTRWVSVPARLLLYSLGYGLPPSPTPSTGYQRTASSPVLRGQWKPDFSEILYLVSLRLHGIWCLPPPPTPCGQQWILRRNGPETHMALSFPPRQGSEQLSESGEVGPGCQPCLPSWVILRLCLHLDRGTCLLPLSEAG